MQISSSEDHSCSGVSHRFAKLAEGSAQFVNHLWLSAVQSVDRSALNYENRTQELLQVTLIRYNVNVSI